MTAIATEPRVVVVGPGRASNSSARSPLDIRGGELLVFAMSFYMFSGAARFADELDNGLLLRTKIWNRRLSWSRSENFCFPLWRAVGPFTAKPN